MDKQLFDLAIGEVPPSTVDVDGVVARERRVAWVYRAANPWVATSAGVVVVAVGAAVLLAPGPSAGHVAPAASETSTQSSTPSPPPSPPTGCGGTGITAPPTSEEPSAAITRLTGVLTADVLQHSAPGTTLEANPLAEYPKGTPRGPLEFYHVRSDVVQHPEGACGGGDDYFSARATTVLAERKGNVFVIIGRLGGHASPSTECGPAPADMQETCVREAGPGGEIVLKTTLSQSSGAGPTIHRVDVTKTDGTGIILNAENVGTDAKYGGLPNSPEPPLTLDQLVGIALDPKVTLYP